MCVYSFEEISEKVRSIAEKHGLRSAYLFGSYARGDADEESDIDLLVEPSELTDSNRCYGGLYDKSPRALHTHPRRILQKVNFGIGIKADTFCFPYRRQGKQEIKFYTKKGRKNG